MTLTLRRLLDLAHVSAWRLGLVVLLGALAVGFGVGLMTAAGYLISRAAEHPPILTLTVTIVAVRFFGLARPLARYAERLAGHDLALRSLARIRTTFYSRIEPLAPAGLESYRGGELLGRMVGDVDSLQGLYLRSIGPPLVAVAVGAACVGVAASAVPAAGVALAVGLDRGRRRRARSCRRAGTHGGTPPGRSPRRAHRRARRSAAGSAGARRLRARARDDRPDTRDRRAPRPPRAS